MALRPDNTLISTREMLRELAFKPFYVVGDILHRMAENNSRMQAVEAIMAIPEEDLRAKGLTRAEAISLNFRHDA